MPYLILLFFTPFIAAIVSFTCSMLSGILLKRLAVVMSMLPLLLLVWGQKVWIGSEVKYGWLPQIGVEFYLKVDALSLLFLYLVAIIIPILFLAVKGDKLLHPGMFLGLAFLLEGILFGFFTARDLALFTFFWEAMLIPLYFIILLWGGSERQKAALKFIVYMIAGGALMVAAVLGLYLTASSAGQGTFNLDILKDLAEGSSYAPWICGIFLLAFAVKTPLFPFHAWLPDVYCQASTSGTILLSALLSKAGIYGVLRIGWGLFPDLLLAWGPLLLGFAIAGVIYGGLAAWMQQDYKRLLAYSSFSHVNFILAGLFARSGIAHQGAILQSLNHGVIITALFLSAGWLAERIGTTAIGYAQGLGKYMPKLCRTTLFFVLASIGLPGTNSFVGELLILFGTFQISPWMALFLALSVVLSAVYMLRFMQKTYFEEASPLQSNWIDMKALEGAVALPLVLLILWIGIYPSPFLKLISSSSENSKATALLTEKELTRKNGEA